MNVKHKSAFTKLETHVLQRALVSEMEKCEEEAKEFSRISNLVAVGKCLKDVDACKVLIQALLPVGVK